jgi:hypothetical protein
LNPYILGIQEGKYQSEHFAIIYLVLKNTYEFHIHNQRVKTRNSVFVHPDGHREAVFDSNKKPVKDGINDASYNYYDEKEAPLRHFTYDISPWILWGNSKQDPTSPSERIYAYLGDLEGGIKEAFQNKDELEFIVRNRWKKPGQSDALAIFIKAIELGEASELFTLFKVENQLTEKKLISILIKIQNGFKESLNLGKVQQK